MRLRQSDCGIDGYKLTTSIDTSSASSGTCRSSKRRESAEELCRYSQDMFVLGVEGHSTLQLL